MIARLIAIALAAGLAGCASVDAVQGQIAERGAAVNDEALQTATWTLCKAISVGSWTREFGSDQVRADAWRKLCSTEVKATP